MRVASVLVGVLAVVGAACSGGDEPSATTIAAGATSSTQVAATTIDEVEDSGDAGDAVATTPPPTSTTSPVTVPPTTESEVAPPTTEAIDEGSLVAYCSVAADLYTVDAAGDLAEEITPAVLETLLGFLAITVQDMETLAPTEALATQANDLLLALGIFDDISAEGGYDIETIEAGPRFDELMTIGDEISEYLDANEAFLVDSCDASLEQLDDDAVDLLALVEAEGGGPSGLTGITDDTGRIRVDAPDGWEVDGLPLADAIQVVASGDLEGFYTTWLSDGFAITAWDVPPGTADAAPRVAETAAAVVCDLVSTEPYDDVLYTGELAYFTNCDGAVVNVFVLAVTDFELATEVIIEGQFNDPDSNLPQAIFESFLVEPAT